MRDQMPLNCLQKPTEWREYFFLYSRSTEIIRHTVFLRLATLGAYRIFGPWEWALIQGGRLCQAGRLLNFHHFQQVKYVYSFCNKTINAKEVTKQGFCKILWRKLCPRGSLLLEFIRSSGWCGGERLFEFDWEEEGWALIRGWALINFFCL